MEIILAIAVVVLLAATLNVFSRLKTLEKKLEALSLRERDDFADLCNAFEEQRVYMDKLHEEWRELTDDIDSEALQKAAERQEALYVQGINNILGYGGGMGE